MAPDNVYKLKNPIEDYGGEEVKEIKLRTPKGREIKNYGNPVLVNIEGWIKVDNKAIGKYIEVLGGITPTAVDNLSAEDFQALSEMVQVFFGNAPETS